MFDKNLFLDNVVFMAEKKEMSVTSLEKLMGVSVGYLAKLRKDEGRKNITADLLFKASDALQVSIDYLCKVECEGLTEDEMNVIAFFEKIKKETINHYYKWEEEKAEHILLGHGKIAEWLTLIDEYGDPYYVSKFKKDVIKPVGLSYIVDIKKDVSLIIVRIESANPKDVDLESYIVNHAGNKCVSKLCATCHNMSSMLDDALYDLYKVAEISGSKISLDEDASSFIKLFLNEE